MKLNGKFYFNEQFVLHQIDQIILLLEHDKYEKIYSAFKSYVNKSHIENVLILLQKFKNTVNEYFKKDHYKKLEELKTILEENKYDSKKESVKLYSQGAYGTIINADDASVQKYVFNKCLDHFYENINNEIR